MMNWFGTLSGACCKSLIRVDGDHWYGTTMSRQSNLYPAALRAILVTVFALAATLGFNDCLAGERAMTLQIFFGKGDPGQIDQDCGRVFAVTRTVPKTSAVAKAALGELFRGPTPEEFNQGYRSWFSEETRSILRSVKVIEGTAYVDLRDIRILLPGATSSCGSAEFFAQVETTLKQFPTIKRVIFAINGATRTFYEWMQIACDKSNNYCNDRLFRGNALIKNGGK